MFHFLHSGGFLPFGWLAEKLKMSLHIQKAVLFEKGRKRIGTMQPNNSKAPLLENLQSTKAPDLSRNKGTIFTLRSEARRHLLSH